MSSQFSPTALVRPFVSGLALAGAVSLLFAAPALAGGGKDDNKGKGNDGPPPFVQLAHDDAHFFDHETNQTRHCTDGHGHDAEHNPHCRPVSP